MKATDIVGGRCISRRFDIKKSEIHGMSQRGGSVASDVRIGRGVLSPMVPAGKRISSYSSSDPLESNRGFSARRDPPVPGVLNGLTLQ